MIWEFQIGKITFKSQEVPWHAKNEAKGLQGSPNEAQRVLQMASRGSQGRSKELLGAILGALLPKKGRKVSTNRCLGGEKS